MSTSAISTRARAHLRSLAHHLEPVVQVGNEGITEAVQSAVRTALYDHELIKVRFGRSFEEDRSDAAQALADEVDAALVQTIGRVAVLYRSREKDLPGRPRLQLPR